MLDKKILSYNVDILLKIFFNKLAVKSIQTINFNQHVPTDIKKDLRIQIMCLRTKERKKERSECGIS
jgi:hypothetical protein